MAKHKFSETKGGCQPQSLVDGLMQGELESSEELTRWQSHVNQTLSFIFWTLSETIILTIYFGKHKFHAHCQSTMLGNHYSQLPLSLTSQGMFSLFSSQLHIQHYISGLVKETIALLIIPDNFFLARTFFFPDHLQYKSNQL